MERLGRPGRPYTQTTNLLYCTQNIKTQLWERQALPVGYSVSNWYSRDCQNTFHVCFTIERTVNSTHFFTHSPIPFPQTHILKCPVYISAILYINACHSALTVYEVVPIIPHRLTKLKCTWNQRLNIQASPPSFDIPRMKYVSVLWASLYSCIYVGFTFELCEYGPWYLSIPAK